MFTATKNIYEMEYSNFTATKIINFKENLTRVHWAL